VHNIAPGYLRKQGKEKTHHLGRIQIARVTITIIPTEGLKINTKEKINKHKE
jgi:hypothetical protein